jgi:hypothetical protein
MEISENKVKLFQRNIADRIMEKDIQINLKQWRDWMDGNSE